MPPSVGSVSGLVSEAFALGAFCRRGEASVSDFRPDPPETMFFRSGEIPGKRGAMSPIYFFKRLCFMVVTLFCISIIIFAVTMMLPGNLSQVILGEF